MKLKNFFLMFLLYTLTLTSFASAQNISLTIEGECHEFNVTLKAVNLEEGCYDVKIEALSPESNSEIFDPRKGWKSSFYYVDDGYCGGEKTFRIRTDSDQDLNFVAKLRRGQKTISSGYYEVKQNCPEEREMDVEYFFLVSLISILMILIGITIYVKK